MSESGTRQVVFAAKLTIIVGAVSLLFLFLPPNIVKTIQEPSALLILGAFFLLGFLRQQGQFDYFYSESEKNEQKSAIYTLSSLYIVGSRMSIIIMVLAGLIYVLLATFLGREGYYIILKVLLVAVFMGSLGITSTTLLWERRRHLRAYQNKIAPRRWLISFKSKNNLYGDEPVRTRGDQRRE